MLPARWATFNDTARIGVCACILMHKVVTTAFELAFSRPTTYLHTLAFWLQIHQHSRDNCFASSVELNMQRSNFEWLRCSALLLDLACQLQFASTAFNWPEIFRGKHGCIEKWTDPNAKSTGHMFEQPLQASARLCFGSLLNIRISNVAPRFPPMFRCPSTSAVYSFYI